MRHSIASELTHWQSPSTLVELANALNNRRLLVSKDAQDYREAWVLGTAGTVLAADMVRMVDCLRPDGLICFNDRRPLPIEVTEFMEPGRQRSKEFSDGLEHVSQEQLNARQANHSKWLHATIQKKLNIDSIYPTGTILLVYHNLGLHYFEDERDRVDREIEEAATKRGKNIIATLILYRDRVYGTDGLKTLGIGNLIAEALTPRAS